MDDTPNTEQSHEAQAPDTTSTDTAPDNSGDNGLSQEQVNKIAADARNAGRDSALKQILQDLGVDNLDAVKNGLGKLTEIENANKSDLEKLQASLEKALQDIADRDNKLADLQQARRTEKIDSALMQAAQSANAHNPKRVLDLLRAGDADAINALLSDDDNIDDKAISKLIGTLQKTDSYLFGSQNPGSPSNAGGRMPSPDNKKAQKAREAAKRRTRRYS